MSKYKLDEKKANDLKLLIENGIGWNIPYAKGTFEVGSDGKVSLTQEKPKQLFNDFMSPYVSFITIEGGKRGGKDVYGLYCWANYLMSCPDKLHLATGQTLKHAITTILEADGFGIQYLLPHGEKVVIDNNPVFRFIDYYGVEKQIMFYAGGEANDAEKFRGITFGSCYCNEAIKQHIDTILEAKDRTISSKWRKIIHTQNPLAGSFGYYEQYEKPLIATPMQLEKIYELKEKYKLNKDKINEKLKSSKQELVKKITDKYLTTLGLKTYNEIIANQDIYKSFSLTLRNQTMNFEKEFYDKTGFSLASYMFQEYYPNPNAIKNGLHFRYYHFNFYDNLAMTDQQRQDVLDTSDQSSVNFKRDIIGIRASSDNAIWDTFTDANIIDQDIPNGSIGDRYLVVDYGMKNDFVVIDCDVTNDFTSYIWKEFRISGRSMTNEYGEDGFIPPTNALYAQKIKEMIKNRNNGQYLCVIVDPSATGLINELIVNGIAYKKAKNDVGVKPKDKPDKRTDKSLKGIWLVRDGFARKKIFIHNSCMSGINECYGYSFDPKKLLVGVEEPIKVADHFPDCVRYLLNTVVKKQSNWF